MKRIVRSTLLALGLIPAAVFADSAEAISIKDTRAVVGLQQGEHTGGQLDVLMPLAGNANRLLFASAQAYQYGSQYQTLGVGLGYRYLTSMGVSGFNTFYDKQRTANNQDYDRVTLGYELLGERWDFRTNAYFYTGSKEVLGIDKGIVNASYPEGGGPLKKDRGFDDETLGNGANLEVGRHFGKQFRTYVGAYHYENGITGGNLRVEYQLNDKVTLTASSQHDAKRGWLTTGGLQYSFGKKLSSKNKSLSQRLFEPVVRDMTVPVEVTQYTKDASTGEELVIVKPGDSIVDKFNSSKPGDIIYIEDDINSISQLLTNELGQIQLKTDQTIWGTENDLVIDGITLIERKTNSQGNPIGQSKLKNLEFNLADGVLIDGIDFVNSSITMSSGTSALQNISFSGGADVTNGLNITGGTTTLNNVDFAGAYNNAALSISGAGTTVNVDAVTIAEGIQGKGVKATDATIKANGAGIILNGGDSEFTGVKVSGTATVLLTLNNNVTATLADSVFTSAGAIGDFYSIYFNDQATLTLETNAVVDSLFLNGSADNGLVVKGDNNTVKFIVDGSAYTNATVLLKANASLTIGGGMLGGNGEGKGLGIIAEQGAKLTIDEPTVNDLTYGMEINGMKFSGNAADYALVVKNSDTLLEGVQFEGAYSEKGAMHVANGISLALSDATNVSGLVDTNAQLTISGTTTIKDMTFEGNANDFGLVVAGGQSTLSNLTFKGEKNKGDIHLTRSSGSQNITNAQVTFSGSTIHKGVVDDGSQLILGKDVVINGMTFNGNGNDYALVVNNDAKLTGLAFEGAYKDNHAMNLTGAANLTLIDSTDVSGVVGVDSQLTVQGETTINGMTFAGNVNGYGLIVDGGVSTLSNLVFNGENNKGDIYLTGDSNTTLKNSTVTNGAVDANSQLTVYATTINGMTFAGNAGAVGLVVDGGVRADGTESTLSNLVFNGNYANALQLINGAQAELKDSTVIQGVVIDANTALGIDNVFIDGMTAAGNVGGTDPLFNLYVRGGNVSTISNATFTSGHAIQVLEQSTLNIKKSSITTANGIGLSISNATVNADDLQLTSESAMGGISLDNAATLTLKDSTVEGGGHVENSQLTVRATTIDGMAFAGNANGYGLIVAGAEKTSEVNNVTFTGAYGADGAVHVTDGAGVSMDSITITNTAGGGMFVDGGSDLTLSNSSLNDNRGNGLTINGSTVTITDSLFNNNKFNNNNNTGHGIYAENDSVLDITGSDKTKSTFNENGRSGIRAENSTLKNLENSTIDGNKENGVHLLSSGGLIKNSLFTEHKKDAQLAGLYVEKGTKKLEIQDSEFTDNDEGIELVDRENVTISGSNIHANVNGLELKSSENISVFDTTFENNEGTEIDMVNSFLAISSGEITAGNLGVTLTDSNLTLKNVAINAEVARPSGDNSALILNTAPTVNQFEGKGNLLNCTTAGGGATTECVKAS